MLSAYHCDYSPRKVNHHWGDKRPVHFEHRAHIVRFHIQDNTSQVCFDLSERRVSPADAMEPHGPGGRFYKSRKSRPCDSCRQRKVVCDMPLGPPCHRCFSRALSCTFEHGPGKRKRRETKSVPSPLGRCREDAAMNHLYLDHHSAELGEPPPLSIEHDLMLQGLAMPDDGLLLDNVIEADDQCFIPHREPESTPPRSHRSVSPTSGSHHSRDGLLTQASPSETYTTNYSLELVPDAFSFYIGPTGAADIHLIAREEFDSSNITRPKISGLKYRRLDQSTSLDGSPRLHPTLFGITDQSLLQKAEPRVDEEDIEAAWSELWGIIDSNTAWRLIKLYSRFIDPYFPIIALQQLPSSPGELSNMPLGLLASICASALPFVVYDEGLYSLLLHPPDSARLYRICWLDISQHLHSPTLATLQACLLLQQRPSANPYLSDSAFAWSLTSTAVSVAQTIGLHRDPTKWDSVPLWERRLRKRLWWAVWMMERWISLVRGMPSHLHEDDFDVSDLAQDYIADSLSTSVHTKTHLCQLVKLSHILADIQKTYYTVRALSRTSEDLQLSLDLARTPRAQLKAWLDNLEPSLQFLPRCTGAEIDRVRLCSHDIEIQKDLDGSASIYLSYIVTHITLFRALLRPLEKWKDMTNVSLWPIREETIHNGAKAVIRGSLVCVQDFVEFLESLRDAQWNAFWHCWSRPNFAIAGSFMVHLLHVTSTPNRIGISFQEEDRQLRALVKRWRVANRVSANGAAGARGLANLGLIRVETMLGKLMGPDDA